MSYSRLAVPVALGLSLATVTAFVVYYVFKKDDEKVEEKSSSVKTTRPNVIEVTVPKSIVPALIGRSGSNIKDIQNKSGAQINFKKFSDKDYDVCIIRGRSDVTQLAETLIHDFIKNQPIIIEESLMVPSWSCGRIIGTRGENINEISHRSGARVKIEGNQYGENTAQRQITIKGTKEQIEMAKGLVDNCVSQEKCRREIEQSKRSPRQGSQPGIKPDEHQLTDMPEVSGSPIEVFVSAVSSPSRFWVQFVGSQVGQLDTLVQEMTDYYSHKENRDAHALPKVSVGQIVAAVFRHDGQWYRARVCDIRPNEFDATQQVADVFFVDYGDSEYVATHELCELRSDLLRLRFQAMECFLAGVRPAGKEEDVIQVTESGQKWDKWDSQAIQRFEDLTQVARWKPLVSKTCTYKKSVTTDGEKEKEIPGIKLYDVTDAGEMDIAATLISEGHARVCPPSPRASPPRYGDLGASRILGIPIEHAERSSSLPKDHERSAPSPVRHNGVSEKDMPSSTSLASGLEKSERNSVSPNIAHLSYPDRQTNQTNGSHEDFLNAERDQDRSMTETVQTPTAKIREEFKANMNRIDSHHHLDSLSKGQ